ncbi:MAG: ABC transporter permease [Gemmatimonadales bacterium]|nr:ABC transporter permease [Gemmatimonadales bacterium]
MSDPVGRWSQRRRAFRLPFSRVRGAAEVDEELACHLAERAEQFMAEGMPRAQAMEEALSRFGNYDRYRRETTTIHEVAMRKRGRFELLAALRREMGHSARVLLRTPAFSVIALVTLALGIGATTAIFAVLDAVVLRPLPYRDAGRLVSVLHPAVVPGSGPSKWGLSQAGYFHLKENNRTLADAGVYTSNTATLLGEGPAEVIRVGRVTASLFTTLQARPALGRLLLAADDTPGGPATAVLSYEFWRRRFGGVPNVIGKSLTTNWGVFEIVGVSEPGFVLPKPGPFASMTDLSGFGVDLWVALQLNPAARPVNSHQFAGVGRLRDGATVEQAQRDLQSLTDQFPALFPSAYSEAFVREYHFGMGVEPLRDEVLGASLARTLWVLFGAVGLVLLIAGANVANLFLVRAEARRRETAVRTALGADGVQMAAHFLSESLLLTLIAGALGLGIARLGLGVMLALAPGDIPRLSHVSLGWISVAFAAAVSLAAGLVFGSLPMSRSGLDIATLREGSRGLTPARGRQRVRSALVVGQVALAMVLLAAAGLMLRSFAVLRSIEPGLDPRGVLVVKASIPSREYPTIDSAVAFHREVLDRLAALPGVTQVGAANLLPLRDFGVGCAVVFREGVPYGEREEPPCVSTPRATPGFFEAMSIRVTGRTPTWTDVDQHTGAAVITRALAERLWPGEDPVGKGINSNGPGPESPFYRIVGVIGELRAHGLDQPPTEAIFYTAVTLQPQARGESMNSVNYVLRTTLADPTSLVTPIRKILNELNPNVPLIAPQPMEVVVERSVARRSFIMTLLGVAGGMALLLSAVGIYGVISYLVTQRRSEIGVRMALGARASQVSSLVVFQSLRLVALGVALGTVGALFGTRVLESLLFGVSATDPAVLAAVAGVLLAIAAMASLGPAWRAARVQPVEVLRGE